MATDQDAIAAAASDEDERTPQMPVSMKAIIRDTYGSADVLELRDIAVPVIADGEVLVRVHAAGCGPDVWHLMTGMPYLARLAIGLTKPKVRGLGWDDEVMGIAEQGSFAEFVITSPNKLIAKPANLSFEQAAAIPISGTTALRAVRDEGKVLPKQTVMVVGAAGGVGSLAVQIARANGAVVTGVCSTSKLDLTRSIGADDVIDYTREDVTDGSRRWDLIIDTAGRRPLSRLRNALSPNGTLVIVGGDGGGRWTGGFFRGVLRAPIVSLFVGQRLRGLSSKVKQEDLAALNDLIEAGTLMPVIDRTYPLDETADATRHLATGHARGKIVISVVAESLPTQKESM
jgi:NADPH:quinone reductase-like Zn-dependent oxidoreductase